MVSVCDKNVRFNVGKVNVFFLLNLDISIYRNKIMMWVYYFRALYFGLWIGS